MLRGTCDFCGKDCSRTGFQLFLRNLTDMKSEPEDYCICTDCKEKIKQQLLKEPNAEEQEIDFTGMPLCNFLRTDLYLRTSVVNFMDENELPINEFTYWLKHPIVKIIQSNGQLTVILKTTI